MPINTSLSQAHQADPLDDFYNDEGAMEYLHCTAKQLENARRKRRGAKQIPFITINRGVYLYPKARLHEWAMSFMPAIQRPSLSSKRQ